MQLQSLCSDLNLLHYIDDTEFPFVLTRAANVYGVHQQLYRIIPRAIIYLKTRKKIELHGLGKSFAIIYKYL